MIADIHLATPGASILSALELQLDKASLSEPERRTIARFVSSLAEALGRDLAAVWLFDRAPAGNATLSPASICSSSPKASPKAI